MVLNTIDMSIFKHSICIPHKFISHTLCFNAPMQLPEVVVDENDDIKLKYNEYNTLTFHEVDGVTTYACTVHTKTMYEDTSSTGTCTRDVFFSDLYKVLPTDYICAIAIDSVTDHYIGIHNSFYMTRQLILINNTSDNDYTFDLQGTDHIYVGFKAVSPKGRNTYIDCVLTLYDGIVLDLINCDSLCVYGNNGLVANAVYGGTLIFKHDENCEIDHDPGTQHRVYTASKLCNTAIHIPSGSLWTFSCGYMQGISLTNTVSTPDEAIYDYTMVSASKVKDCTFKLNIEFACRYSIRIHTLSTVGIVKHSSVSLACLVHVKLEPYTYSDVFNNTYDKNIIEMYIAAIPYEAESRVDNIESVTTDFKYTIDVESNENGNNGNFELRIRRRDAVYYRGISVVNNKIVSDTGECLEENFPWYA